MKIIQRQESEFYGGLWSMKFTIGTSHIHRSFTDLEYGGKEGSLRAAQDFLQGVLRPMLSPRVTFTKE